MAVRHLVASFALLLVPALAGAQTPPRDSQRTPAERPAAADSAQKEASLRAAIAAHPGDEKPFGELARFQEDRGAYREAEATLLAGKQALPKSKAMLQLVAGFYNRQGDFDHAIAALSDIVNLDPSDPPGHHTVATYYWEKAQRDTGLSADDRRRYIAEGVAAEDRALALKPDYMPALVYKNILLRMQANGEPDAATRRALIAQADELHKRAMELQQPGRPPGANAADPQVRAMPVLPPPDSVGEGGQVPLRVGGEVAPPAKIRDVRPLYPADAQASGVQGVVIIEATIGTDGRVSNARILRSIPVLDSAALDAVRQWEFVPTLLNGQPVPVIMTVTVNFSLQ